MVWREVDRDVWKSNYFVERPCSTCGTTRRMFCRVAPSVAEFECSVCFSIHTPESEDLTWPDCGCMACGFPLVGLNISSQPMFLGWWHAMCFECGKSHQLPYSSASQIVAPQQVFCRLSSAKRESNRHRQAGSPGWVYVMLDLATKQVKVGGTSRPPEQRWAEHPRGLIPLFAEWCADWKDCERSAHRILAEYRVSREEWFNTSPNVAIRAVTSVIRDYARIYMHADQTQSRSAA